VIALELAWEYIQHFLAARYLATERFQRRLEKIARLEQKEYSR
jgi:ribose 5-phosphate isomerase RpiB